MCFVFISCSTGSTALEYRMDLNWLSAVSLLGTCGGDGIGVRSYRIPSECHTVRAHHNKRAWGKKKNLPARQLTPGCQAVSGHVYRVSPTLFFSPNSAVLQETET